MHKKLKISDKNIDSPSEGRISDNSITTLKLSKIYEKFRAVDSLTIKVDSGDIFGFLGPNGAGKTTTIRMLCGLLLPSSGSGEVCGYDIIKDSDKIGASSDYYQRALAFMDG